ncbi:endoribonuclease SymE [Erwinia rhapontici]|uniref:Endoribonuclease SymE n=1 Tax=Erwinia rhapontici TaxID=55212 RepID=A0ABN6DTR4_ERWRD|nr:SymE family type I addiction module toxin [Erwinia rhapontici]BCQ36922.1 endoribonuclease SymE [Erwinia rhapontici]BCQ41930.1 endoribonuclease SymE [Erwinia rhapontici]
MSYIRDSRTFESVPAITLKGNWLAEAGFDTGTPLNVRVLPDCLILTVNPPSVEPEVMQTLRQVCPKLSARKQRQITEFIQVIAGPQKRAAKV